MAAEQLVQLLEDFFCSPKFTSAIGQFLSTHVPELEFRDLEDEQPIKNFEIFQHYTNLVDQELEEFVSAQGLSSKEVYEACAAASLSEAAASVTCIDYLVASTEYESFMQLAYDHYTLASYKPEIGLEDWDAPYDDDGILQVPLDAEEEKKLQPSNSNLSLSKDVPIVNMG